MTDEAARPRAHFTLEQRIESLEILVDEFFIPALVANIDQPHQAKLATALARLRDQGLGPALELAKAIVDAANERAQRAADYDE